MGILLLPNLFESVSPESDSRPMRKAFPLPAEPMGLSLLSWKTRFRFGHENQPCFRRRKPVEPPLQLTDNQKKKKKLKHPENGINSSPHYFSGGSGGRRREDDVALVQVGKG